MIYQLSSTPTGFKLCVIGTNGRLLQVAEEAGSHSPLAHCWSELDRYSHNKPREEYVPDTDAMAKVLFTWNAEVGARDSGPLMTIPFDMLVEPTKDDLRELARRLHDAAE